MLGGLRVYRWLRGGHWELVYILPPVSSEIWVRQPHGTHCFGERLVRCENNRETTQAKEGETKR